MIKIKEVNVLIPFGQGFNTDREMAYAFKVAGANPEKVHFDYVTQEHLKRSQIFVISGGFADGDAIEAGRIRAALLRLRLDEALQEFIDEGKLVMGVCNGAQVLVKYPLLPRLEDRYKESVSLIQNANLTFRDDWVKLKMNPYSPCVFTKGIDYIEHPIRHGEGRFVVADRSVLEKLRSEKLIVAQYSDASGNPTMEFPDNPNGSLEAIAGISDRTGRIFAWMPHPEAFNINLNHPDWTFRKETAKRKGLEFEVEEGDGIKIFRNAVNYIIENL